MATDNSDHPEPQSPAVGPSELSSDRLMTRRQKIRLVGLVVLKRVRFILVLVSVGVFIGYWDTVKNYWDKYTRPRSAAARQLEPGHEFYCPMDPQVVRSTYEPNGDVPKCPICGMPLSERLKGEAVSLPAGVTGRVQLTPERVQLAGIKTVLVEYRPAARRTKTVGYVAFDESRLSRVVSRVEGYVEKLYVDRTYAMVRKGDPLAEIYSPELYSAAQELILLGQGNGTTDLAASARKKLSLLGVSSEEINAIVASGEASPRLVIRSPQTGYVIDKKIVPGSSVETRMTLLDIADLSTVWIEADVYEKDIAFLEVGQQVEATVEAIPNRTFSGKLTLIAPRLDPSTRTIRVRFELDNRQQHALRPGMFATVRINTPLESIEPYKSLAAKRSPVALATSAGRGDPPRPEFLCVPERAVIDTGSQKIVYVEREPGMFEGVEVELGPRLEQYYPVIKGLKLGDRIAAAGGFLIDAETRLNPAAAATYFGASGGPQTATRPVVPLPSGQPPREPAPANGDRPDSAPAKVKERVAFALPDVEDLKNLDPLPAEDRKLALAQHICPVTGAALGSMGVPIKITLRNQPVFLCCAGCRGAAKRNPKEMLKILAQVAASKPPQQASPPVAGPSAEDLKNLEKLPAEDRKLALAQKICPVTGEALGSMGVPVKIMLRNRPVFLCCHGCQHAAQQKPDEMLNKLPKIPAASGR